MLTISREQQKPLVDRAIRQLKSMNAKIAGMVFNKAQTADFKRSVGASSLRSIPRNPETSAMVKMGMTRQLGIRIAGGLSSNIYAPERRCELSGRSWMKPANSVAESPALPGEGEFRSGAWRGSMKPWERGSVGCTCELATNVRRGNSQGSLEVKIMMVEHANGESGAVGMNTEDASPRRKGYVAVKMAAEWVAAVALLVILAPVIALLAALVKASSPGPAFYSQVRQGLNGRPYRIFKLRSMTHNCEAKTGAVWSAGANDARVTPVGRLLRDTHLDELPQLWNVVRGDMCLVGPRPERPEIASKLERALPEYSRRLLIKPGVTGLAQVQLPPDTDLESVRRKLAYDLHYVREVSFVMDMRILFATFFGFTASAINAVARSLVHGEKSSVESRDFGGLKLTGNDWRVGAA